MADLKTTITEVVTGLGMCGSDDVERRARAPARRAAQRRRRRLRARSAPRGTNGAHRDLFVGVVDERAGVPRARDGAARPAPARRRVEGRAPLGRRRGRAGRPPRRPRVPRQLQVPLAHRRERVAAAPLRPAAQGRARPAQRRRLVRRGRAGRARGALRRGARPRLEPTLPPDVDRARRRAAPRRSPTRSTRQRVAGRRRRELRGAGRARRRGVGAPLARRDRRRRRSRCCGGCCASAARRTSCSARRRRASLRLRIATPWDWRQHFELRKFEVEARAGGQPMVAWDAVVRERAATRDRSVVDGHVEVRWSHGRFCGPPEAKVYLDTAARRGARATSRSTDARTPAVAARPNVERTSSNAYNAKWAVSVACAHRPVVSQT